MFSPAKVSQLQTAAEALKFAFNLKVKFKSVNAAKFLPPFKYNIDFGQTYISRIFSDVYRTLQHTKQGFI